MTQFQMTIREIEPFFTVQHDGMGNSLIPGDVVSPRNNASKSVVLSAPDLINADALSQALSRAGGCDVFIMDTSDDREIYFGFDPRGGSVCGNGGVTVRRRGNASVEVYSLQANVQRFGRVCQAASRLPAKPWNGDVEHLKRSCERLVASEERLNEALQTIDEPAGEARARGLHPNWQKRAALHRYVRMIRATEVASEALEKGRQHMISDGR